MSSFPSDFVSNVLSTATRNVLTRYLNASSKKNQIEKIEENLDDLPVFANEQSVLLNAEIRKKEAKLDEIGSECKDQMERIGIMEEHLKNVNQEIQNTNYLVESSRKDIDTQNTMRILAEREFGRLNQEIKRENLKADEQREKLISTQNKIKRESEKLNEFREKMRFNSEELSRWIEEAKEKEDSSRSLQRYRMSDDTKVQDLQLQLEKLSKLTVHKKTKIDSLFSSSLESQTELERLSQNFKQIFKERQQLVEKWKDTSLAIQNRDKEIQNIERNYSTAIERKKAKEEMAKTFASKLKFQEEEINEANQQIEESERILRGLKQEQDACVSRLKDYDNELSLLKASVCAISSELERKKAVLRSLNTQIEAKSENLAKAKNKFKAVSNKIKNENLRKDVGEKKVKSAEEELKERESDLKAMEKAVENLKICLVNDNRNLEELKAKEFEALAEVKGADLINKNLKLKLQTLDSEKIRHDELLYKAEFELLQLEKKVDAGTGKRTKDESLALKKLIEELKSDLKVEFSHRKALLAQFRGLKNELRNSTLRLKEIEKLRIFLSEDLCELKLKCKGEESALKASRTNKEEALIQSDLLRFEAQRFKDELNCKVDLVFSLETDRQGIVNVMKERKAEIAAHLEVQKGAIKMMENERHQISKELAQQKKFSDKMRAKYETLCNGEKESGGESSRVLFLIAAAQRREELKREGDRYDCEIREKEREIRALESTLKHLNAKNVEYKMSFKRCDSNGTNAELLRDLEDQLKVERDRIHFAKKEYFLLQNEVDEDEKVSAVLSEKVALCRAQNHGLERSMGELGGALERLMKDRKRSEERVERLRKVCRERNGDSNETNIEKSVRCESMREAAANVLFALGQLANEFPEMEDALKISLKRRGLAVPRHPPKTRMGSSVGNENAKLCSKSCTSSSSATGGKRSMSSVVSAPMRTLEFCL